MCESFLMSLRDKKTTFLKNDPGPCATLKQVLLDRFEVVVAPLVL